MIVLTDSQVVGLLTQVLEIDEKRILYGQLNITKSYWIEWLKKNEDSPNPVGNMSLYPFVAFYHRIRYDDERKDKMQWQGGVINDLAEINLLPINIDYTIEILGDKVIDQIDWIKKFMFRFQGIPKFTVTDGSGDEWLLDVIPEDPEDTSDLEDEEEMGRTVRTTFTMTVKGFLLDAPKLTGGIITKALLGIHLYNGDLSSFTTVEQIVIT